MSSPIKYSFELLNNFCSEKGVKLVDDYSKYKLFGSSKIHFFCTKCNKETSKYFTYLITPFNISNADFYGIKKIKSIKSIVGVSPTMVLLFHLPFVYLKM